MLIIYKDILICYATVMASFNPKLFTFPMKTITAHRDMHFSLCFLSGLPFRTITAVQFTMSWHTAATSFALSINGLII